MTSSSVSCPGVLDSLLHEIAVAEAELAILQSNLANQKVGEVAALKEEIHLLKNSQPEGLVEDDSTGIEYFLAMGKMEAEVTELRKLAEITEHNLEGNKNTLASLQSMVEDQREVVKNLELKNEEHQEGEKSKMEETNTEVEKLDAGVRLNKTVLRELKMSLRKLIDSLSDSSPGTSCVGLLMQELWASFVSKGFGESINLGDLAFEVEDEVVQQLVKAGLVVVEGEEKEMLRMIDFTCSA